MNFKNFRTFIDILHTPLFESKRNIPSANKDGDCYIVSARYMERHASQKSLKLVHGLVSGQGALEGIVYNHAWVEDGDRIIDMTLKKEVQKALPKILYYGIGNIKTTFSYTFDEMIEKLQSEGTYGPWEKKLKSNKY